MDFAQPVPPVPKPSQIQLFISWFKRQTLRQKISLVGLGLVTLSIPVGIIATLNEIRSRSNASPISPPTSLPITPPEQLINTVLHFPGNPNTTLSAVNTAPFYPDSTGSTVEFWINFDFPSQLKSGIVHLVGNDRQLSITLNAVTSNHNGIIEAVVPPFENQPSLTLKTPELKPNTWYHVALIHHHRNSSIALHIDGKVVKVMTYHAPYNLLETVPKIFVGAYLNPNNQTSNPIPNFEGYLEDFRLSSAPQYYDADPNNFNGFFPYPFNQLAANEFTILWKFNHSPQDSGPYNVNWSLNPEGYIEYVEPDDPPTHSVCAANYQCVSIPGGGENECDADSDCDPNDPIFIESGCKVGGCSNELCVNQADKLPLSLCEYKDEYQCYRHGVRCETQSSGNCGWTQTPELLACLGQEIVEPSPSPLPSPTIPPTENGKQESQPETKHSSSQTSNECRDPAPTSPADLYQINIAKTDATLYFAPAGQPYSHYVVQYGENNLMEHSASFEAKASTGALTADIHLLKPNTVYTFRVLAFNHCASGTWSNNMTVKSTAGTTRIFYKNIPLAVRSNFTRVLGRLNSSKPESPTKLTPIAAPAPNVDVYPQTSAIPSDYQPPTPQLNFFQRVWKSITSLVLR